MSLTSKARGLTLAGIMAFGVIAPRADAAAKDEGPWSVAAAPILSIHPAGESGEPYLSEPLAGSTLGLAFVLQRHLSPSTAIALEVSSSLALTDEQTGRFIFGPACYTPGCPTPVTSTHRDTIANLLASLTLGNAEVKAGPGVARSRTHQGDDKFNHYDQTNFLVTAGLDLVLPIGRRFSLVPTARYHFVFRGDERLYGGLSRSVVRLGVGVRFREASR